MFSGCRHGKEARFVDDFAFANIYLSGVVLNRLLLGGGTRLRPKNQAVAMKIPSSPEPARFRFVRDGNGGIVNLPRAGSEERILLALDCERWGLARLHVFEGAATRKDKLEAFEDEMQILSGWESDSVSRLYSWGRDGGELFYASAMRDGEPLPDYLGRTGKVPVPAAARWLSTFIDSVSAREEVPASIEQLATVNFEVARDRRGEAVLAFSEFTGWKRPGARFREHRWEWNLVQVLCSLIDGVPLRNFHPDSLPRNFEELPVPLREIMLPILAEDGRERLDALRGVLHAIGKNPGEEALPPRMPMREWLARELIEVFPGESGRFLPEAFTEMHEAYSVPTRIRGAATSLQVLPGENSLPREGWLNQHHDSTRRPGRGLIHQVQINLLEDAGPVTLIGEEQVDGIDLATLLESTGPLDLELVRLLSARLEEALDSLERRTGACSVWWLPAGNVLMLTGTKSASGSAGLFERKGRAAWIETPLKFRLHQTLPMLLDGIDLPAGVRELSKLPGKPFEGVRRSAVALPLLWTLLTGAHFSWRRRAEHSLVPPALSDRFERFRLGLVEDPESVEESFFRCFSHPVGMAELSAGMIPGLEPVAVEPSTDGKIAGVWLRKDESLFQEEFVLAPRRKPVVAEGGAHGVAKEPAPGTRPWPLAFWLWTTLAALVAAGVVGIALYEWTIRVGPYEKAAVVELSLPGFEAREERLKDRALQELSFCLLSEKSPRSLGLLPMLNRLDAGILHREIEPWLRHLGAEGDPTAPRIMGMLAQAHGDSTETVIGWYLEGARKGDSESCYRYAAVSWDPLGKRFSNPECEPYLRRAVAAGHPGAGELLAHFLSAEGESTAAYEAMDASAAAGWVPAIYQTGLLVAAGNGCSSDPEKGVTLLRKAAELGEVGAMYDFGRCVDHGFGVSASHPEAIRWMRLAAGRGHGAALRWLLDRKINPSHS
jgi:hypothetical protein